MKWFLAYNYNTFGLKGDQRPKNILQEFLFRYLHQSNNDLLYIYQEYHKDQMNHGEWCIN